MATWKFNGTAASALGISGVTITKVNQGQDICEFQVSQNFDSANIFAQNSTVVVTMDDVRVFVGRVIGMPRFGAGDSESVTVTLAGPWWYLDNIVFQQRWVVSGRDILTGELTLIPTYVPRVVIGQDEAGDALNSTQVLTEGLNWAVARGAPIALGDLPASVTTPWSEHTDLTVAELVRMMLRWMPDATAWFDYTTTPNPTLHITRRSGETPVTLSASSVSNMASLQMTPRWDLQVPSVIIKFEQADNYDGTDYTTITTDIAPGGATGLEIGAAVMTIDLQGANSTTEKQKIVCEQIDPDNASWWVGKFPWLSSVSGLSVSSPSKTPSKSEELIEGTAPWWKEDDFVTVECRALLSYTSTTTTGSQKVVVDEEFTVSVTGSDFSSQTFTRLASFTAGEPVPSGLAASLYAALSVLQWDGNLSLVNAEPAVSWRPGMLVNISDGLAAWTSMNAQVQRLSHHVDSGTTQLTLGPAHHLGPQDRVEMLRAARGRRISTSGGRRETGKPEGTAKVQGPANSKESSNASAGSGVTKQVWSTDGSHQVTVDSGAGTFQVVAESTIFLIGVSEGAASITAHADGDLLSRFSANATNAYFDLYPIDTAERGIWGSSTASSTEFHLDAKGGAPGITLKWQTDTGEIGIKDGDRIAKLELGTEESELTLTDTNGSINLTTSDITSGAAAAGTISLRELDYCDAGTAKKILVLCSAPYSA